MLAGRSRVVGLVIGAVTATVAGVLLLRAREPVASSQVHPIVALVEDDTLPPWFVAPGAPERIAGRVFHAEGLAFVELTLDIPGTARWRRTALVGADGRFDFGPRPRGRYELQAVAPNLESRWVQLDTAHERGDRTELYVYPPPPPEPPDPPDPAGFWFVWGRPILPKPHWQGQILDMNGAPLPFVALQPIWDTGHSHGGCAAVEDLVVADAEGRVALAPDELCGVTIFSEGGRFDVELGTAGRSLAEPLVVDTRARQPADTITSCGALYERFDPRGAWVRGKVVDERGTAVPDAQVSTYADLLCGTYRPQRTHARSDGSFELYLAEKQSPGQRAIWILAGDRRGLAYVTAAPGQTRDGLVLEVGRGHVVEGRVVDEDGRPVEGAVVATADYLDTPLPPTDATGHFTARIGVPGRHRLWVVRADDRRREHLPLDGLGPAIDVDRPVGTRNGVELRVWRTTTDGRTRGTWRDLFDLGLRVDGHTHRARIVRDEAERAGIRIGDRVTKELPTFDPLTSQLEPQVPIEVAVPYGSTVRWWVQRDGVAEPFRVELRAPPIAVH